MSVRFYLVPFLWGFVPALLWTLHALYQMCWHERQVASEDFNESDFTLVRRRLSTVESRSVIFIPIGVGSIVLIAWLIVYVTTVGIPQ